MITQGVVDPRRNLAVKRPRDNAVAFQLSQLFCQYLAASLRHQPHEFTWSAWRGGEVVEENRLPLASNDLKGAHNWTLVVVHGSQFKLVSNYPTKLWVIERCGKVSDNGVPFNPSPMKNVLIVHAHPEPKSFSSALARTAAETFTAMGYAVSISDLYAMSFSPASGRQNFQTVADPAYLKLQAEENAASQHGSFAPELEAEMRKLENCDLLVFSFPLWWFGMPAILKGWVDRVFAYGRIYGRGRWYEHGIGRGKQAFALLTTGSPATAFHRDGLHAPLDTILSPLYHGVFWFNGFSPLPPFVTWGAAHLTDAARGAELNRLRLRVQNVGAEDPLVFRSAEDSDPQSFKDRIPRFLLTARKRSGSEGTVPATEDLLRLSELRRTGVLVQAMIGGPDDAEWQGAFELRCRDLPTALACLHTLPLAKWCDVRGSLLNPAYDQVLSPFWPAMGASESHAI